MRLTIAIMLVVMGCDSSGLDAQPQVIDHVGGPVLTTPTVVPVFFVGDSVMQGSVEGMLATLPGSSYWHATTAEYGVGDITVQPSVVSTDAPPTTDDAIQQLIDTNSDGTHGWPAATPQTIYAVFLPDGVTETDTFGTSCVDFGAYHDETYQLGIAYALVPRCDTTSVNDLSPAIGHELIEASTDPYPGTRPAYESTDNDHAVWTFAWGGEIADMCEATEVFGATQLAGYFVPRVWSNAAARTGGNPCVPNDGGAYPRSVPVLAESLSFLTINGDLISTPGVSVPVGTSKTIAVDLHSELAMPDWTVAASVYGGSSELTFSWDQTTGNSGDTRALTITRATAGTRDGEGGSVVLIDSELAGVVVSEWIAFVGN